MAKDKSESKAAKEERKRLKAEKATPTTTTDSGVSKVKTDKKDKKEKKAKREALAEKVLNEIEHADTVVEVTGDKKEKIADLDVDVQDAEPEEVDEKENETKKTLRPIGALVPFANPLADEKVAKKVFKTVKKAAAQRTLKRGVKEVVKALRKSPNSAPASSGGASPHGIVILAADISPMDVISHIPVLCEDHNIPYIYVTSRAELGMAGQTKRPTSVVMVNRDSMKRKDGKENEGAENAEEWSETYQGLLKTVEREGKHVKV